MAPNLAILVTCLGLGLAGAVGCYPVTEPTRVLVFSRVTGFRHDAIDAGLPVLTERLAEGDVGVDATEDPADLADLRRYAAVVFFYTDGEDVLDDPARASLEAFVRGGGGFFGIHSATNTEKAWPFYRELVVAEFTSHPAIQEASVTVEDHTHPATAALPDGPWVQTDEWYNFDVSPREDGVQILATVDETTYDGGTMGTDHPVMWCHERVGGRVFYTALGHPVERWQDPVFVDHVVAGVRWVAGLD